MNNSTNTHAAIVAADQTFMTTFSRGDAAGLAALYTENGQFLPPNSDFVTGKQAIQATFQAFMDMGIKAIKLETIEVEGYGDTASEVGSTFLRVGTAKCWTKASSSSFGSKRRANGNCTATSLILVCQLHNCRTARPLSP